MPKQTLALLTAGWLLTTLVGCASYTTPGPGADMSLFTGPGAAMTAEERAQATDWEVREALARKPLAQFPAHLAVARVQGSGYCSYTTTSYGQGRYSVVTTRDVETDEHLARLAALPSVEGVAPIGRLLLPPQLKDDADLRRAAAQLHADLLLIYTFDTDVYVGDNASPVDLVTLGFLPNHKARVVTTASAVLVDTRNGYVYGLAEGTAQHRQIANTWTSAEAVDQSRRKTEAEAFDKLLTDFEQTWRGVLTTYAAPPAE